MNIIDNINTVDLKNINSIKNMNNNSELTEKQLKKLKEACADFEAIFYHIMFQSARKSTGNEGIIKRSRAEEIFTDMFDSEISKEIANRSKNGIKDMLFNYLTQTMNINKNINDKKIDVK
jgi:flagellar protein FlgJ